MKKRREPRAEQVDSPATRDRRSKEADAEPPSPTKPFFDHDSVDATPPTRRWRWVLGVGFAVVVIGLYVSCGSSDRSFRKWTPSERESATARCEVRSLARDKVTPCIAQRFCACAVANYEARETSIREFQESLLPAVAAYAEPGSFGYFCTEVATSACR